MALIRDEDIDEVRERTDIVDAISTHVNLKKAGRLYKGLCPFHNEKTPSFTVDPDRQLYHCFGCGEGGNVYTFVMKTERMDFPDAVKYLADKAGYNLRLETKSGEKQTDQTRLARLYALNKRAEAYFGQVLKSGQGESARKYIKSRGYTDKTVETFSIGLSPSAWDELTQAALKQGATVQDLVDAGLSIRNEKDQKRVYDRFRGRLMFPITDMQDRVVGFGGRVLGEETPKYLNTPETPVFHKGKTLYALNMAKTAISETSEAVIVEGYTDVIALQEAGIKNVVATLGTALTGDHLRLLARYAKRIVLVFDADVAGEKAVERGLDLAAGFYLGPEYKAVLEILDKRHLDLFVASLPAGDDPADFIGKKGPDEFRRIIGDAVSLIDFSIRSVMGNGTAGTISAKREAADRAMEVIAKLPSAVTREHYLKFVADKLDISYGALFADFARIQKTRVSQHKTSGSGTSSSEGKTPEEKLESEVLKAFITYPDATVRFSRELGTRHFTSELNQRIFSVLAEASESPGGIDVAALIDRAGDERLKNALSSLAAGGFEVDDIGRYTQELLRRIKEFEIMRRINTLKGELTEINPQRDTARYDELFDRLLALESERREL